MIYSRISRDSEGEEAGVERQEADCRELAARLGFEVVDVFRENDVGASTRSKKKRPIYAQMLTEARVRRFEAILAYSNSRLTRRLMELEELIQLYEKHGTRLFTVVSGNDDLSTADGRMVARIKASVDAAEAERIGERVSRAKRESALDGRYRGGPRPFGFEQDGMTLRTKEADLLREAARGVLAGRSLAAIAKEWEAAGVKGTQGTDITYNHVRDLLLRPRNAGLVMKGLPGRKGVDGSTRTAKEWTWEAAYIGPAKWPGIISEDEFRALVRLFLDPDRRMTPARALRWLGSGIYRCGVPLRDASGAIVTDPETGEPVRCGGRLRPIQGGGVDHRKGRKNKTTRRSLYRCVDSAHLTIAADRTDAFVLDVLAERLRDRRVVAAMHAAVGGTQAEQEDREERDRLRLRQANAEADYAEGLLTGRQLRDATDRIGQQIAVLDDRLAGIAGRRASSPVLDAPDPGAAMLEAPIDVQRALLREMLTVTVLPARYRGTAWTSDRLVIEPVTRAD